MPESREQLLKEFLDCHKKLFESMRKPPTKAWLEHDLTMHQFQTIMFLKKGPIRMGELASSLDISVSSATATIDRLVEKGLVQRAHDPSDRRTVTCDLTDKGRKTIRRLWQMNMDRFQSIADVLSDSELKKVTESAEILIAAAKQINERD